jgi:hypothetical protein
VFELVPNSKGGWNETVLRRFIHYPEPTLFSMIFDTESRIAPAPGRESKTQ